MSVAYPVNLHSPRFDVHTEVMENDMDNRNTPSNSPVETKPLTCADGLTRLVALHPWYWEKLDLLLVVDSNSVDDITRLCLTLADQAVQHEDWALEPAFRELLMYYIYRNYHGYMAVRHNLANDNRQDCFAHLND